jgi:hypothetical protein
MQNGVVPPFGLHLGFEGQEGGDRRRDLPPGRGPGRLVVPDQPLDVGAAEQAVELAADRARVEHAWYQVLLQRAHVDDRVQRLGRTEALHLRHHAGLRDVGDVGEAAGLDLGDDQLVDVDDG